MRSAIVYGCFACSGVAKTYLSRIDRVHNKALRICTGAMRTTPINVMQVETGEAPVDLRRDKLMMSYWIKLQGCGNENPAKGVLQDCWEYGIQGKGLGWTAKEKAVEYGLDNIHFSTQNPISAIPPWFFPKPEVDFKIMELKKEWAEYEMGVLAGQYIRSKYYSFFRDLYRWFERQAGQSGHREPHETQTAWDTTDV